MSLSGLLWLVAPPLCWGCGAGTRSADALCRGCRGRLCWLAPELASAGGVPAYAPLSYDGPARELVRGLKFRGARGLADVMAAPIVAGAPRELLDGAVLVPVPLARDRRRRRGFNQAERLAAALAARTRACVSDCLERTGPVAPQAGRSRGERMEAARATVRLRAGRAPPARAVLVDDVITTGSTLAACARALRAAGARGICAVAYARTPGR
jgi:ComF family protein